MAVLLAMKASRNANVHPKVERTQRQQWVWRQIGPVAANWAGEDAFFRHGSVLIRGIVASRHVGCLMCPDWHSRHVSLIIDPDEVTCGLAHGTFEPRQSDDFTLEPLAGGTVPRWQLRVRRTGEALTVRFERDGKGTWLIGDGERDAPLRVPMRLLDANSRPTTDEGTVGHLGFDDFWRLFAEHRTRTGFRLGSTANPPAGVW